MTLFILQFFISPFLLTDKLFLSGFLLRKIRFFDEFRFLFFLRVKNAPDFLSEIGGVDFFCFVLYRSVYFFIKIPL